MVRTQIQLTAEQARILKELAHVQKISMAELIRRQVDSLIKLSETRDRNKQIEQAKEACGKYGSGGADISEEHDSYLAGDFFA